MGKIYKITSFQTDLIYVGSTTEKYLCDRLSNHISEFKYKNNGCSSKQIIKYGDAKIELIKLFPCNSKDELTAEESNYIRALNCVNIHIPGRTKEEWYETNKEKNSEKRHQRYEENKEKEKEYYEANKQKILDRLMEPIMCSCGCKTSKGNLSRHLKTNKHLNKNKELK